MTLWRQVLATLNGHSLDHVEREAIPARGAAHLATRRTPEGQRTTHKEVTADAFEEFGILLDTPSGPQRPALPQLGTTRGYPAGPGQR